MPRAFEKTILKVVYPPGCKELSEDLNKDELLKRLKSLARAFQDMGQDENNRYTQLALYLASPYFLDHSNKDVKLLVACCIADVFRIFAPEAPYTEVEHLKEIFMFLTRQLRGLRDPESPTFKRYFYLLENLAWVKSFNICIELDDNQEIFCNLYKLMFGIVNEKHSNKVVNFMLDMMCPLITEADSVSQELLDIILINIIEPYKSQNRLAYNLARDLIRRTSNAIEPYMQTFFNNALMLGKSSDSEISKRLFDLIYELNMISPSVLLAVLPQLDFKLKSNDELERKAVVKVLAKMFSDPGSDLAAQNKPLWICFLGRFNDIDVAVRRTCVQAAQEFIVNHPGLVDDISEPLQQRQHDPDESVRMDVIQAIVGAAKKDFPNVTDALLTCVKERTRDKKFKIRKEALMGLGQIYRLCTQREEVDKKSLERVGWIRSKVLHAYYQSSIEDKVLVERILNVSLVPYSLEPDERMKRLYHLYGNVDENAVRALQEIFKMQLNLRTMVRNLLELDQKEESEEVNSQIQSRLVQLARNLPEPVKMTEYLKKFNVILKEDARIRSLMGKLVSPDCSCKKAEECVREVLKKLGNPIPQNHLYANVKTLLERIAPVMIDSVAIKVLMKYIDDAVNGLGEFTEEIPQAVENGMKLLLMLSYMFPGSFQSEDVFTQLIGFVKHEEDAVADGTLEIFTNIGQKLEQNYPNIFSSLLPVLQKLVKIGTPKQVKHSIRCINKLCKNKDKIYSQIFAHLKKNMDLDSPYFLSSIVAIGHMAEICPGEFGSPVKLIVSKFIVKELLMQDRSRCRKSNESWYDDHLVSLETQQKVQALKMLVRWLLGLKSNATNSGTSTLRLLHTFVIHEGDLMERGKINKAEMARLRLQAGVCLMKLAQEPAFADLISLEQFQALALLINDTCYQVRLRFSQKLHKGLIYMRLPLQYMSIFALAANDPVKERRLQVKQFLLSNINKRRELLKTNANANAKLFSLLPDYVLPYAIHLLAHDPELESNDDLETLKNIKECLWFILEPLIKNENYSYSFYRKLIENIKQTKDKQCPDSPEGNKKLYAVCDLALGLVMTKTANFLLKDFPAEPVLPARLFTNPDQKYSNMKNYLPKELMVLPLKQFQAKRPPVAGPSPPAKPVSNSGSDKVNGSSPASESSAPSTPSPTSKTTKPDKSDRSAERKLSSSSNSSSKASPSGSSTSSDGRRSHPKASTSSSKVRSTESSTRTGSSRHGSSSSGKSKTQQSPKKDDSKSAPNRSPRRDASKEDRPPAHTSGTQKPQRRGSTPGKGQGKITDYVSRPLASKNGKSGASQSKATSSGRSSPRDSLKGSPGKGSPGRGSKDSSSSSVSTRQTRTASSPAATRAAITRKRESSDSHEPNPAKRAKASPTKSTRLSSRNLSSDLESENGSVRSSPRKRGEQSSKDSPAKRTRGRSASQASGDSETIPSPSASSSKSSSSPSPKKKVPRGAEASSKKGYPIRKNLRRAGPMVNGTSDGEEDTPDSIKTSSSIATPPKKRAAALARAIEEQTSKDIEDDEQLNVKRRGKKRRR